VRALTAEPDSNFSALAWSPAGTRLAAVRFDMGTAGSAPEVWVFEVSTGEGQRIVQAGTLPRWVP